MKSPNIKNTFSFKKISAAVMNHYSWLTVCLFIIIFGYGIYVIYQTSYGTIFGNHTVAQEDIKSRQEKINIERYDRTSKVLSQKQEQTESTLKNIFTQGTPFTPKDTERQNPGIDSVQ